MSRIPEVEKSIQKASAGLSVLVLVALTGCACDGGSILQFPGQGPPGVAFGPITPRPEVLPGGATAFYPSFDGDTFTVMLPAVPQPQASPSEVLEQIEPALRAAGFERSLSELGIPNQPIQLPAPDLAALAEEVCRESALEQQATSREICIALRGGQLSAAAQAAIQDSFGVSFAALKADLEQASLQYAFPQLVDGVLIESSGVLASSLQGESISSVHGSLYNRYVISNQVARDSQAVLETARFQVAKSFEARPSVLVSGSVHVLLPYGSRREGDTEVTALRHAWRVLLGVEGASWLAWIDAENGAILRLAPQWDEATPAQGERWRRDPGVPTHVVPFAVDPLSGGKYTLELDNSVPRVFRRFDRLGDGIFGADEVAVTAAAATATANFNLSSINNEATAICAGGGNTWYRQVHAFSHLYSFWKQTVSSGTIPSFPENPITVWTDRPGSTNIAYYDWSPAAGDANSVLNYIAGDGFVAGLCPNVPFKRLNGATDATILIHEMSHLSVKRLQDRRPAGWCGSASCWVPSPEGRLLFHDFADAFAIHYASIDCVAGWTDKNSGGTNASLYCKGTPSEGSGFPRRFEAAKDRFPGHRKLATGGYADGQIAAAGLWGVRQGMRSKEAALGTVAFLIRLQRALWDFGLDMPACTSCTGPIRDKSCTAGCDRDIYQYLQDLEEQMVTRWAAPTSAADWRHTANKVLSGWAAVGIFLVPYSCLDGSSSTTHITACPAGDGAGDAVIDVLDRDPADDLVADGVTHPEWDTLERGGPPPRFRVWTGPAFRFDTAGKAWATGPLLCHSKYTVEVSASTTFSNSKTVSGTTSSCYTEIDLPTGAWTDLRGSSGSVKLYYRVRTTTAAGGASRISTSPGAGAFAVPPPFFVVNDSGTP